MDVERVLRYDAAMDSKNSIERDNEAMLSEVLAGKRALSVLARRAMSNRKRRPEDDEAIAADPPDKPKPIIDGAEVPVE